MTTQAMHIGVGREIGALVPSTIVVDGLMILGHVARILAGITTIVGVAPVIGRSAASGDVVVAGGVGCSVGYGCNDVKADTSGKIRTGVSGVKRVSGRGRWILSSVVAATDIRHIVTPIVT